MKFLNTKALLSGNFNLIIALLAFLLLAFFVNAEASTTCQGIFMGANNKPTLLLKNPAGKWSAPQAGAWLKEVSQKKLWSMVTNPKLTDKLDSKLYELIKNGANIYAQDDRDWTPLDYAANTGNLDLVQALTRAGNYTMKGKYKKWLKPLGLMIFKVEGAENLLTGHKISNGAFQKARNTAEERLTGYKISDYKRALRIAKSAQGNDHHYRYRHINANYEELITYLSNHIAKEQDNIDSIVQSYGLGATYLAVAGGLIVGAMIAEF